MMLTSLNKYIFNNSIEQPNLSWQFKFLSMTISRTQIFHKVMWQHVHGVVGSLIIVLLQIYL